MKNNNYLSKIWKLNESGALYYPEIDSQGN